MRLHKYQIPKTKPSLSKLPKHYNFPIWEMTRVLLCANNETITLRRMGICILKEEEDIRPEDNDLHLAVVGNVTDQRDFHEEEIREWVNQLWITNHKIRVEKVGKLFFFICVDIRERSNLASLGSANYKGSLILFTKCQPRTPFRSLTFLRAPVWIRVEGLSLLYNKTHIALKAELEESCTLIIPQPHKVSKITLELKSLYPSITLQSQDSTLSRKTMSHVG